LDEKIDKLTNKMVIEFNEVFIVNCISNRTVYYEFDSAQSGELKISSVQFDEMTKKVRK